MRRGLQMVLLALVLAGASGCPKPRLAAPPAALPPPMLFNISFAGVKPGGKLAHLTYAVQSSLGPLDMHISDPTQPQGTTAKLDVATLKLGPYVLKPKVTAQRAQECLVDGCYTLCVRDSAGVHIGDFEVNPWGALVLKRGTVDESRIVQKATALKRNVYFVFRKKPGGGRGELAFALEFKRNEHLTQRMLHAADGWHYNFASPDGLLAVYEAPGMLDLFKHLLEAEAKAKGQTLEDLDEWSEKNQSERKGVPSISGPPVPGDSGGYCTGGG